MIYFISNHIGAVNWSKSKGVNVDEQYITFNNYVCGKLTNDDLVIGALSQAEIKRINAKGSIYVHFDVDAPKGKQGHSLGIDELEKYNADFKYGVVDGERCDYLTALDKFV